MWPHTPRLCPFLSPGDAMIYKHNDKLQSCEEFTCKAHKKIKIVSLKLQAFQILTRQTKRGRAHAHACAVYRQVGCTATWRVNRTLPVPARAQLRTFFSNVWRDRQSTGQMHLSTR